MSNGKSSYAVIAFFSLVLIQISVGLIYKLASRENKGYAFSQASALAMSELFKLFLSTMFYYRTISRDGKSVPLFEMYKSFRSECPDFVARGMGVLGVSYLINNHLAFYLFSVAAGTINLVKSGSTFISATILWIFAGRVTTQLQWVAIIIQVLALICSQKYDECQGSPTYSLAIYGLCLLSTCFTASSGCYNDYLSKASSASLHAINMWLYSSGFVANLVYYIFTAFLNPEEPGFFEGYMGWGMAVVVCNSIIGIAVTAVYKYADAVVKCIAQSVSTAALLLLSAVFFGASLRFVSTLGCLILFCATYIYLTCAQRKPEKSDVLLKTDSDTVSSSSPIRVSNAAFYNFQRSKWVKAVFAAILFLSVVLAAGQFGLLSHKAASDQLQSGSSSNHSANIQ